MSYPECFLRRRSWSQYAAGPRSWRTELPLDKLQCEPLCSDPDGGHTELAFVSPVSKDRKTG